MDEKLSDELMEITNRFLKLSEGDTIKTLGYIELVKQGILIQMDGRPKERSPVDIKIDELIKQALKKRTLTKSKKDEKK